MRAFTNLITALAFNQLITLIYLAFISFASFLARTACVYKYKNKVSKLSFASYERKPNCQPDFEVQNVHQCNIGTLVYACNS